MTGRSLIVTSIFLLAFAGGVTRAASAYEHDTLPVAQTDSLRGLPVVEVPAAGHPSDTMAVIISGDGGWADLDKKIGEVLSSDGVPVVGLDTRHYLHQERSPEETSHDLARILDHYLSAWNAKHVILIGYSHGADLLPFMAAGLPAPLLQHVSEIALVGVAHNATFKYHTIDLLMNKHRATDLQTLPEIEKLTSKPILCFYGVKEKDTVCRDLTPAQATVIPFPGGHHFGGHYQLIAQRILSGRGA
ncbi:MAG TPA: AcvB/VirJ family lysyl-phosphatidylglycerol hydrolase [Gemmatimonadaceae bacterium]